MLQTGMVMALGTMSGTSLDGVDAAIVVTDGVHIAGFGATAYRPYSLVEQYVLRTHLGLWQSDDVATAAYVVENAHLEVMRMFGQVTLGGFHGQTLAHDPGGRGTHQCGDGQLLAELLGYPVVWDFRSADVAAGGQGAPLAPFYHFALAKWIGAEQPVAFLNLGGVGNITWVDPEKDDPTAQGALLAFDTGPANAPMNDLMQQRRGQDCDIGGGLAASGRVHDPIVTEFMRHPYFAQTPPKSLDRDAFDGLLLAVDGLNDADAMATLNAAVVATVVHGVTQCPSVPAQLFVTGGGRHNATLMTALADALSCDVAAIETVGLNGDMLEAQAFAFLAVRAARGMAISGPESTGIAQFMTGGQLSDPAGHDLKLP